MKKLKTILLFAMCAGLTPLALLHADDPKPENDPALMAVETIFTVSTFREAAAKNTNNAVKAFFNQRAGIRWLRISNEFSEEQLQDFFIPKLNSIPMKQLLVLLLHQPRQPSFCF